ncbi:MAG TPA: helix-turn-helix transcriptional regulator [Methanomicrobiales archaeon]|nr:helix-turn-helix transcriptional regulator [Methanomicrobiales archaeon]
MRDLEVEILDVLGQAPCHVYALKYLLESREIEKSHSDLYKIMRSLEKRSLVTHRCTPSSKGPERKVFSLTDTGGEALEDALKGGLLLLYRKYLQMVAAQVQEQIALEIPSDAAVGDALLLLSPLAAQEKDPWVAAFQKCLQDADRLFLADSGRGADPDGFIRLTAESAALPFPDEQMDFILAPYLSLVDMEAVLDEMSRILSPEGIFMTLLPIAQEAMESSLLVECMVREMGRQYPPLVVHSRLDFIRELDAFFHVMSIPYRESSLFICRKEVP